MRRILTKVLVKRNISQNLLLLTFITLTGVGLIGYADYKTNQKLVDSGQLVQHTERVIYQSDNLYSLSKDIEIQTQGCLITNDGASLQPRIFPKTIFTYIVTKEGLHYTDRINAIIKDIQQEENRLLTQRIQTNERSVSAFKTFSVVMLFLWPQLSFFYY
jgi:CHASE3 domain sensor protein